MPGCCSAPSRRTPIAWARRSRCPRPAATACLSAHRRSGPGGPLAARPATRCEVAGRRAVVAADGRRCVIAPAPAAPVDPARREVASIRTLAAVQIPADAVLLIEGERPASAWPVAGDAGVPAGVRRWSTCSGCAVRPRTPASHAAHPRHPPEAQGRLRAPRARQDRDVRLRHHRLRPVPRRATPASAVAFDVIARYLRQRGFEVKLVRNITDVDDKIIRRAQAEGRTAVEVAETYIQAMADDFARAGPGPARQRAAGHRAHRRRASTWFARLEERGLAYAAGRRRLLRRRQLRGLRQPVGPEHRRAEGRRAHRGGRAEAQPARLRPVEGGQAGRAVVAQPLGPGPARLAHRMFGHVLVAAWARPSTCTAAAPI